MAFSGVSHISTSPAQIQRAFKGRWIAVALLLLAAILRLFTLGKKCFWLDEVFSFDVCRGLRYDDSTPMLFYSLNRYFLNLPFSPEINGRLWAAILGIMTVWVIYLIARDLLPNRYWFWVMLLAVFNPLLIQLSQEMRAYGMITFLCVLFLYAGINMLKIARENSNFQLKSIVPWAILLILSAVLGLYTHYVMLTLLLSFFVACMMLGRYLKRKGIVVLGLSYLLVFMMFLPHLGAFRQRLGFHPVQGHQGIVKIGNIAMLAKSLWKFNLGEVFEFSRIFSPAPDASIISFILLLLLFLGASMLVWLFLRGFGALWRVPSYIRVVPLCFLVLGVFYLIIEISSYRQMAPILPFYLLILAAGIYNLRPGRRFYAALWTLVIYIIALGWFYSLPYQPMRRIDWRAAGDYLNRNVKSGDIVFAACSDLAYLAVDFYYRGEIVPVDEETRLYHSSPRHLKRQGVNVETFHKMLAARLKELLETKTNVHVVIRGDTDQVTPLATSLLPSATAVFGDGLDRLTIKSFCLPDVK